MECTGLYDHNNMELLIFPWHGTLEYVIGLSGVFNAKYHAGDVPRNFRGTALRRSAEELQLCNV